MMSIELFSYFATKVDAQANRPSGPMFVKTTPLPLMNCKAVLTFSAFCTRMRGLRL